LAPPPILGLAKDLYTTGGVRLSPVNLEVVVTGHRNQEIRILER
jgi:hypothetical protein